MRHNLKKKPLSCKRKKNLWKQGPVLTVSQEFNCKLR